MMNRLRSIGPDVGRVCLVVLAMAVCGGIIVTSIILAAQDWSSSEGNQSFDTVSCQDSHRTIDELEACIHSKVRMLGSKADIVAWFEGLGFVVVVAERPQRDLSIVVAQWPMLERNTLSPFSLAFPEKVKLVGVESGMRIDTRIYSDTSVETVSISFSRGP